MAPAVREREMPGRDAGRAAAGGAGLCCAVPAAQCMAVPPRWLCSLQLLGHCSGKDPEPEAGRNPRSLLSVVSPGDFCYVPLLL